MPLKTLVIGFGMIAAGNDHDPVMGKTYKYPSHMAVLKAHKGFLVEAVVDPSEEARNRASEKWGILKTFSSVEEACKKTVFDVAVICTPPQQREQVIVALPPLLAVIIEKPLGTTSNNNSDEIYQLYQNLAPVVQVNYWRRADKTFRGLANGVLHSLIGVVQGGVLLYGNGLHNNGIHLVDFIRMLVTDISAVQAVGKSNVLEAGPFSGDIQFSFNLILNTGVVIHAIPLDFSYYRENGIDLWGSKGRLSILQDSRTILFHEKQAHGGLSENYELASDKPQKLDATFGEALYELYDNTYHCVKDNALPYSPLSSAIQTEKIFELIKQSYDKDGKIIDV